MVIVLPFIVFPTQLNPSATGLRVQDNSPRYTVYMYGTVLLNCCLLSITVKDLLVLSGTYLKTDSYMYNTSLRLPANWTLWQYLIHAGLNVHY